MCEWILKRYLKYPDQVRTEKNGFGAATGPLVTRIRELDSRRSQLKSQIWDRRAKVKQYQISLFEICTRMKAYEHATGFTLGVVGTFLTMNPWTWPARILVAAATEMLTTYLQAAVDPWLKEMARTAQSYADRILEFSNQIERYKAEFNELSKERAGLATQVRDRGKQSNDALNRLYQGHSMDFDYLTKSGQCDPSVFGPNVIPDPDAEGSPPKVDEPDVGDPEQFFWQRLYDPASTDSY